MNRDQKAAVIEQIAADIRASQAVFAVDYRGITVAQADALRARLRDCDASFRVVKNSLTERAADAAGADELRPLLAGPTALTFVRGDAAAAAKAISDFARTTQLLAFKGGMMDGAALSSADVTQISRLPARDVLYGQLVGLIASPIAGLARTLNALIGGLAVGLGAVLEQRGGAAGAADGAPTAAEDGGADSADGAVAVADEPVGDAGGEAEADAAEPPEAQEPAAAVEAPEAQTAEAEAPAEVEAEAAAEAPAEAQSPEAQTAEVEPEAAAEDEPAPAAEAAPEADASTELEGAGEPAAETDESKEN